MAEYLVSLMGLSLVQLVLYRIDSRRVVQHVWVLILFYLVIFYFAKGLQIFSGLFAISFYELPLFALILMLVFGGGIKRLLVFQKKNNDSRNFYFFSGLWLGLLWLGPFSQATPLEGLGESLLATLFLIIMAGIKERLELLQMPASLKGLPILFISGGTFLLGFIFLIHFKN